MASPQISFTIVLNDAVTIEQYEAILQVISDASQRYSHLIQSASADNIPPGITRVPISITGTGVANDDVRNKISAALNTLVQDNPDMTWTFADAT